MIGWFKDREHLLRVFVLLGAGLVCFLLLRWWFSPRDFGEWGPFRTRALAENSRHPSIYAGAAACVGCHDDVAQVRHGSKHERIGCESCHGTLAQHAAEPAALEPKRPDGRSICLVCHQSNAAKPASFPQIDPADHGDAGKCIRCHAAHHPEKIAEVAS